MDRSIALRQASGILVIACPHPFAAKRITVDRPAGGSVADLMRSVSVNPDRTFARVFIDDRMIPEAEWEHAIPKAGNLVTIRVVPTDGGSGGGKDVLRLVAMIAIVAVSAWVAGGGLAVLPGGLGTALGSGVGAAVAGATVGIGLSLAMNARIPAPLPRRPLPQPLPAPALKEAA